MNEVELVEKILLNFGETTPELLVIFMLIRWVWPDLKSLVLGYLEVRQVVGQSDPVAVNVQALSVRVDAVMQGVTAINAMLGAFVEEVRRNNAEMARLVEAAVGLVGQAVSVRAGGGANLPPVSPNAGPSGDGGSSAAQAARSVPK